MVENFDGCWNGLSWLRKDFWGYIPQLTEGVVKMGFPFPVVFAYAAALSEFAGGIFVAAGLLTRLSSLMIFVSMGVAAFIAHANDPLNVKELALGYWAISGALFLTGAGMYSLDQLLFRRCVSDQHCDKKENVE